MFINDLYRSLLLHTDVCEEQQEPTAPAPLPPAPATHSSRTSRA